MVGREARRHHRQRLFNLIDKTPPLAAWAAVSRFCRSVVDACAPDLFFENFGASFCEMSSPTLQ
jgi:hypothetical protein